jgi:hypothetical protein
MQTVCRSSGGADGIQCSDWRAWHSRSDGLQPRLDRTSDASHACRHAGLCCGHSAGAGCGPGPEELDWVKPSRYGEFAVLVRQVVWLPGHGHIRLCS